MSAPTIAGPPPAPALAGVEGPPGTGRWVLWFWVALLGVFLFAAFTGDLLAPYDPFDQAPVDRLSPPMTVTERGLHIFGTDPLGRDSFSNIILGTRLTLLVGLLATAIGTVVGTLIGAAAGYYGGWVDRIGMRLAEAQTAMPMFLVAILLLSLLGPSVINLVVVLPALIWPTFARIIRAETLRLRSTAFIEAAQALGCTGWTIMRRHLIPNLAGRIGVLVVVSVGHVMLAEAGLSFLGVGVQPPDITWGLLISLGRQYLAVAWWLTIIPGLFLGLVVLSINMIGRHFERNLGAAG